MSSTQQSNKCVPLLDLVQIWPWLWSMMLSSPSCTCSCLSPRQVLVILGPSFCLLVPWSKTSCPVFIAHGSSTQTPHLTFYIVVSHLDALNIWTFKSQETCCTTQTNSTPWLVQITLEPTQPKLSHLALIITRHPWYGHISTMSSCSLHPVRTQRAQEEGEFGL